MVDSLPDWAIAKSVGKALERLVHTGDLHRVATGIYVHPVKDNILNFPPSFPPFSLLSFPPLSFFPPRSLSLSLFFFFFFWRSGIEDIAKAITTG